MTPPGPGWNKIKIYVAALSPARPGFRGDSDAFSLNPSVGFMPGLIISEGGLAKKWVLEMDPKEEPKSSKTL